MTDSYDDGTIVCGPEHLEIRHYYFPLGAKRIPYARIEGIQRFEITGVWSGRWRLWGTGNPRHWANLDLGRPGKHVGYVVDVGRRVSAIVTPDDPDAFESVLRSRVSLPGGNRRPLKGPYI